jgi:hypothetical protein
MNKAVRVIFSLPRHSHAQFAHIGPYLYELHWLPILARVEFKMCVLVYQAVNMSNSPHYLKDLIAPFKILYNITLRHMVDHTRLSEPSALFHRASVDRCFYYSAPRIYNRLPHDLKATESLEKFRKMLKAQDMNLSFDPTTKESLPEFKI